MKLDSEERQLVRYRTLRDEALALVRDDLEALRIDLDQRGLGARLADRVGDQARDVWEQTLEVAAAHRSVVAGTLLALVAWLMRKPIVHGVGAIFGADEDQAEYMDDDDQERGQRRAPGTGQRQEQGDYS